MPNYGSLRSPSLRKHNDNMDMHGRRGGGGGMRMDNIMGDPFALATISIAALAWIITLVSQIICDIKMKDFPNYAWLTIVWMLAMIILVFVTVASNNSHTYGVAIVGYLSIGVVVTTSAINNLIYRNLAAAHAASAGNIILAMIAIVWIFYFGSAPSATSRAYLDSFALNKEHAPVRSSRGMSHTYGGRPETSVSSHQAPQMYTSAQLNGFETSSPVQSGFGNNNTMGNTPQQRFNNGGTPLGTSNLGSSNQNMASDPTSDGVTQPTEYPYRAKAIYSYEANPEDANEISFSKHEILEVSDVSGRWWQAKKANGDTGIAPSNYLILL